MIIFSTIVISKYFINRISKSSCYIQILIIQWQSSLFRDILFSWAYWNIFWRPVQLSSVETLCPTLQPYVYSRPGLPVHHQLPEFTQTHVHWVDSIQPSHPLSYPSPPALNLSQQHGLFKWVSSSHQVAKNWRFSFNISLSNDYSGLISFRVDWLDLLAAQRTLKSLLQYHSSKASILRCSAFFIVQPTSIYDYWKNHSLD